MEAHGDGYKDFMKEDVTYSASGVLFDRGKGYLQCIRYVMGLFVGGNFCSGGSSIGKVDG